MKKKIKGSIYCLGDNIDTDQIIPAKHLVYSIEDSEERKNYGKFSLSGLPKGHRGLPFGEVNFVKDNDYKSPFKIIIAGKNFGCGSSREHAPLSLKEAGVELVVAKSYARIFYRNCIDGGFFPPVEFKEYSHDFLETGDEVEVDLVQNTLTQLKSGTTVNLCSLGFIQEIIEAGDLFSYAKKKGQLV